MTGETTSSRLDQLCAALGIVWRYQDGTGQMQEAPDATRRALAAALGWPADSDVAVEDALAALTARAADPLPDWAVLTDGKAGPALAAALDKHHWRLTMEEGAAQSGDGPLPRLPTGYHLLEVEGRHTVLLSAPAALPSPARGWGVIAPIYALRPEGQAGIGSYGDLTELVRAVAAEGGGFVGVNPVHAGFSTDPGAFGPYSPSSRRRFDTQLIDAPGEDCPADGALIDYPTARAARQRALRRAFEHDPKDAGFTAWRAEQGPALELFATHQALSELHGPYWGDWPTAYQVPDSPEVAAFAAKGAHDIAFHAWLQWRAEGDLSRALDAGIAAGMAQSLYLDLAVGTHPYGAETWAERAVFATGVSLGAPPDAFSKEGQRWNLAPFSPTALIAARFRPLAETIRQQLKFSGMLRIDHILGFERAFWLPDGLPGAYVTMPKAALLAVLRIEAARAGAVIVGEDLGNIPPDLRADLDASGILGCRVAMFERDWAGDGAFLPGAAYDSNALASFSTHDLPTWEGWRQARDVDWRYDLGAISADEARAARGARMQEVTAFEALIAGGDVDALHRHLATANSLLVAVQAEVLAGMVEQQNLPGTVHEHPNWRRRLPRSLIGNPCLAAAAAILRDR